MKSFPIYIVALAAVAAIGVPAAHAQATSPADANHPGSQPAFATQGQPEQSSAAQQPAQPAAQPQQQRRQSAPTAARRAQPTTTGSGSQQR